MFLELNNPKEIKNPNLEFSNNSLADVWSDIKTATNKAFSGAAEKLDKTSDAVTKTSDTVTKATETANKALDMASGMISVMKPVAIGAGILLTLLIGTQTYLNFRYIVKGK